jgi:hypothetical protein
MGYAILKEKHLQAGKPMPKGQAVRLSVEQRQELEQVRDHHPKAYMRVKAAASIKVAAGQSRLCWLHRISVL